MYDSILLDRIEGVVKLTLNRPERVNAFDMVMGQEMAQALEEVNRDPEARVLILTGAGRGFCAGRDFSRAAEAKRVASMGTSPAPQRGQDGPSKVAQKLIGLDMPTIAMVNGPAAGTGFDLALACDMRIGSENARFQVGFIKRGVVPFAGGAWLLPRMMGLGNAARLIFADDAMGAEDAYRMGILQKLVPASELEAETMDLARRIAANPPLALRQAKRLLYRGLSTDLDASLDFASASRDYLFTTEDFQESVRSVQEKRAAQFQGR